MVSACSDSRQQYSCTLAEVCLAFDFTKLRFGWYLAFNTTHHAQVQGHIGPVKGYGLQPFDVERLLDLLVSYSCLAATWANMLIIFRFDYSKGVI